MQRFKSTQPTHLLLQGCIRNERHAQEKFFRLHIDSLFPVCRLCTSTEEEACELLQQAFIKIFLQVQWFDPTVSNLHDWMRSVMVYTSVGLLKKKNDPSYVEWADMKEVPKRIRRTKFSIQELSDRLQPADAYSKTIFALYNIEGKTVAEIASLFGISEAVCSCHLAETSKYLNQVSQMKATA